MSPDESDSKSAGRQRKFGRFAEWPLNFGCGMTVVVDWKVIIPENRCVEIWFCLKTGNPSKVHKNILFPVKCARNEGSPTLRQNEGPPLRQNEGSPVLRQNPNWISVINVCIYIYINVDYIPIHVLHSYQ